MPVLSMPVQSKLVSFHSLTRSIFFASFYSVADVSSTVTFTCNGKASGYYADPETCRMYYVCDSGDIYRLPCDLGTYFDPVTITCSLIEDVPCNAPNLPLFCDSRQDGVFPDIDDCSSFYICVFSLTYPISCVDGLIWNQDLESCVLAENGNCDLSQESFSCDGRGHGYYPDLADCTGYYHCAGRNTPYRSSCGQLYWNQQIGGCDFPDNVACNAK